MPRAPQRKANPADLTTRNLHKTRRDIATLRAQLKALQARVRRLERIPLSLSR